MKTNSYVVYWIDNVNLCVTEVSSSKEKAKFIAEYADSIQGFGNQIEKFEDFIVSLKSIRRCKDENWIDFSPSAKEVRNAKVDYLYDLINDKNNKTIDYEDNVISIGVVPKVETH